MTTAPLIDEETPLLPDAPGKKCKTPLPKLQLGMLLAVQLAEPICALCIYPFINELVSGLDIIGGDTTKVGYYAGLIESLFFLAEASTVFLWSRASDIYGRKPILMSGLLGLCISMLAFGLSKTFFSLAISRCLAGILNGNIGVSKSAMAEVTDPTNMAQAFSLMPVVWCVGVTLGPLIGGTLSNPFEYWPHLFSSPFWQKYPYFLPCAACAAFGGIVFVCFGFFFKETLHKELAPAPITRPPSSESLSSASSSSTITPSATPCEPVPLRALITRPVIISVSNYITLALIDIAYAALLPLFYYTSPEQGGLGLSPSAIGVAMAAYGICNGVFQGFLFSSILDRFGAKRLFTFSIASFGPLFAFFPLINQVARHLGVGWLVWCLLALHIAIATICDMAFACVFLFITASAPNKNSLGAVNGLAQTAVSIARAIGPACATSLFAFSTEFNLLGGYAVYVIMIGLVGASLFVASRLPNQLWDDAKDA